MPLDVDHGTVHRAAVEHAPADRCERSRGLAGGVPDLGGPLTDEPRRVTDHGDIQHVVRLAPPWRSSGVDHYRAGLDPVEAVGASTDGDEDVAFQRGDAHGRKAVRYSYPDSACVPPCGERPAAPRDVRTSRWSRWRSRLPSVRAVTASVVAV